MAITAAQYTPFKVSLHARTVPCVQLNLFFYSANTRASSQLAVFEHGAHAFSRQLPDGLLPGPLCYVPKTDCFLTATAAGAVACYRYRALAEATADDAASDSRRTSAGGGGAVSPRAVGQPDTKLAAFMDRGSGGSGGGSGGSFSEREGKRLRAEWTVALGEQILELKVGQRACFLI